MATCASGHENPTGQRFCGECGIATPSTLTVCPHGHPAPKGQPYCGDCGAPVRAPVFERSESGGQGRWALDPFARHQYRFWNGTAWSEHVADNALLSTDAPPRGGVERWIGVTAGVVTAVLLAGAASAVVTAFSRTSEADAVRTTTVTAPPPPEPVAPQPIAPAPPPDAAPWPVAVIGAHCRPHSNNAVTNDGSVAYCVTVAGTDGYLWSLYPDVVETLPGEDPSVAVCMAQTDRSDLECADYLARPSDPGDGRPVTP